MVAVNDDRPFVAGQLDGLGRDLPLRADHPARVVAAVDVGAGIGRVGQDAQHPGMGEPPPAQLAGPHPAIGAQRESTPLERRDHLIGRPARPEGGEHVGDRGRDLGVRVDDGGSFVVVDQAHRQGETQLAAFGRGPLRPVHPSGQEMQFRFGHRALQAEEEAVVEVRQVVDAIGVDDQGVGEPGQLQQAGQVRRRAGQAGHLQAQNGADLPHAHPTDQLLEPCPAVRGTPRKAQVDVDDLHHLSSPTQPDRLVGQRILAGGRLGVVPDLGQSGLADVHDRRPLPVARGDLLRAPHGVPPTPRRPYSPTPPPPRPTPAFSAAPRGPTTRY